MEFFHQPIKLLEDPGYPAFVDHGQPQRFQQIKDPSVRSGQAFPGTYVSS